MTKSLKKISAKKKSEGHKNPDFFLEKKISKFIIDFSNPYDFWTKGRKTPKTRVILDQGTQIYHLTSWCYCERGMIPSVTWY